MKKKILCAALAAAFLTLTGCQNSSESESSSSSTSPESSSSSSSSVISYSSSSSTTSSSSSGSTILESSTVSSSSTSLESSSSSAKAASSTSKQSSASKPSSTSKQSSSSTPNPASSSSKPKPASSSEKPAVQEPKVIGPYNQREQTAEEAAFCEEVFELTNQERAKRGLEPLKKMDKLSALAVARAWENTVKYGHKRPDGSSCFTILDENGMKYRVVAENVAMGQHTPVDVVASWMNSSGHRENILNPDLEYLGVGYYYENGSRCWAQIFYTPANW